MKRLLPFFLILFSFSLTAQITYEDFEGTPLDWNPFGDGVYNGAVANPDQTGLNTSATVGSYTKSNLHAYSLLIAFVDPAMDLSVNNQFSIDIYSPVATQVLFKLEGSGEAIESVRNIANANVWQRYNFDFSAAAGFTTITKIIFFFDPGVEMSGDTYLFDNIMAGPAGPCAGTVPDPNILDDFECQRNASYSVGWDVLQAVANPDISGINTSASVGEYEDPPGTYTPLIIDYNSAIDLTVNNVLKVKIRAPVIGLMLFKLEGGLSPSVEMGMMVSQINTWEEYVINFSSQANADHKKIVIFFNAGVEPAPGEIYHIDDISLVAPPPIPALEDFESGPSLGWEPLNQDMVNHGTFDGVVANPDQAGINDSPNVGKYTKGGAAFSTVSAFLPSGIDLSTNPQLNLHVYAPGGSLTLTMQLVSAIQGNKDITRDITATGEWILLEFNFAEHMDITDFERINLLFDPGTASPGTFYLFDNLTQGGSTVDPCDGTIANTNILDNYECQRNVSYGCGNDRLEVIVNPNLNPDNPSSMVGEYTDVVDEWSALCFVNNGSFDLSVNNQLNIKIWATATVPLMFKLEGGTSAPLEFWSAVTVANGWEQHIIDFSSQADEDYTTLAIFFNGGVLPTQEDIYYVDDVLWKRAPYTSCIANYDDSEFVVDNWTSFENGSLGGMDFAVVPNPNASGINSSATVAHFIESSDGSQPWAGFFAPLDNYIVLTGDKTIRVKALMPNISSVTMKLENSQNGAPNTADNVVANTVMGQWEELVFDFSAVQNDSRYQTIVFIFNILEIPASDQNYYIDDIVIGSGGCFATGVFDFPDPEPFVIYPNPVHNLLFVKNMEGVKQVEILNLLGQKMQTFQVEGNGEMEINVSYLQNGMYLLAGYNSAGILTANAKFVKQ